MRKAKSFLAKSFLIIFFLFITVYGLSAQEDQDSPPFDSEWDDFVTPPFSKGDMNFSISMGVLFPVHFSGLEDESHGLSIGGTGSLSFNYFLTPSIFLGGELSGSFNSTRRGNMLYMVPFGARLGYQFWYRSFEFPVSVLVGGIFQSYLDRRYVGIMLKPGASVYWRYNPEWSFGLNGMWWVVPQWPKNGNNVTGNFLELTVSVRYNF